MVYLSLSSHISTLDKNYKCLERLMNVSYDPPISLFQFYFSKFHEEAYQKKLIWKPKNRSS